MSGTEDTAPRRTSATSTQGASTFPSEPESFDGGSPREIILQFAAGELTREQVVNQLLRWPYLPSDELSGPMDDLLVTVPGSFDDVEDAMRSGLLPADVYDEILSRFNADAETS